MHYEIREPLEDESDEMGRVHVKAWATTYGGIVSEQYIRTLSVEAHAEDWKQRIISSADFVRVATLEGRIVGLVHTCFARTVPVEFSHEFLGELNSIYVVKEYHRLGIGRALFDGGVHWLKTSGINSMFLWVIDSNPAKHFYERMHGIPIVRKQIPFAEKVVEGIGYGWRSL